MNLDGLTQELYGMTKAEAFAQNICISCKKPPTFYSPAGKKEYPISGLCEPCFDKICGTEPSDVLSLRNPEEPVTVCPKKYQPDEAKESTKFSPSDFDPKYDFDCIKSERAFADAKANGLVVVVPEADELQLDIDNETDYLVYLSNTERFDQHIESIQYAKERPSRSGNGKHITIKLANVLLEPDKRILYQLFLGSDRVRELLSYVRFLGNDPVPTLFVEKPETLLLNAAPEVLALPTPTILTDEDIPY